VSGSEKNRFLCVWSGSEPVVLLNHSRCSKWRPFAFTHACSHVCHWLCRWCPEEYGLKCQWASASAHQCRVSVLWIPQINNAFAKTNDNHQLMRYVILQVFCDCLMAVICCVEKNRRRRFHLHWWRKTVQINAPPEWVEQRHASIQEAHWRKCWVRLQR